MKVRRCGQPIWNLVFYRYIYNYLSDIHLSYINFIGKVSSRFIKKNASLVVQILTIKVTGKSGFTGQLINYTCGW